MNARGDRCEVLFVDDDLAAAETYARLVADETGLATIAVSLPDEAVETVRAHPIKVAVLDQKMPLATGTDLLPHIRAVDPKLRAVLLTGEADFDEVGKAVGTFQVFLKKAQILQLPGKVLEEYGAYLGSIADTNGGPIYSFHRGIPGRRFKVEYYLTLLSVVDPEYIPDDAWQTVVQVNAGETKSHSETVTLTESVTVNREESASMATTLGLKGSQLQPFEAALRGEISERLGMSTESRAERVVTHQEEYAIAPEATEPGKEIRARAYQHAPVQRRLSVAITKRCSCCDGSAVSTFRVFQGLPRVATRQLDFLGDDTQQTHRTGDLQLG